MNKVIGKSFEHVRVGDQVTRMLGNKIPITQRVHAVDDKLIYTKPDEPNDWDKADCWTFCRKTGLEIDEELSWGPEYGVTGSYLINLETLN